MAGNYMRTLPYGFAVLLQVTCFVLYAASCFDGIWFKRVYNKTADVSYTIGGVCSGPQDDVIPCPSTIDSISARPGWVAAACVILLIGFILLLAATLWMLGVGFLFALILTEKSPPRIPAPEVMSAAGSLIGFVGTMVFIAGAQATFKREEILYDWGFAVAMCAAIVCIAGVPAMLLESKRITKPKKVEEVKVVRGSGNVNMALEEDGMFEGIPL